MMQRISLDCCRKTLEEWMPVALAGGYPTWRNDFSLVRFSVGYDPALIWSYAIYVSEATPPGELMVWFLDYHGFTQQERDPIESLLDVMCGGSGSKPASLDDLRGMTISPWVNRTSLTYLFYLVIVLNFQAYIFDKAGTRIIWLADQVIDI